MSLRVREFTTVVAKSKARCPRHSIAKPILAVNPTKQDECVCVSSSARGGDVWFTAPTTLAVKLWTWEWSSLSLSGWSSLISNWNDSPKSCHRKPKSAPASSIVTSKLPLWASCRCPLNTMRLKSQWNPINKTRQFVGGMRTSMSSTLPATRFIMFTPTYILASNNARFSKLVPEYTVTGVFKTTHSLHVEIGMAGGNTNRLHWNRSRHFASPSNSDSRINLRSGTTLPTAPSPASKRSIKPCSGKVGLLSAAETTFSIETTCSSFLLKSASRDIRRAILPEDDWHSSTMLAPPQATSSQCGFSPSASNTSPHWIRDALQSPSPRRKEHWRINQTNTQRTEECVDSTEGVIASTRKS